MSRLTFAIFLSRARKAHGDKYDYGQVILVDSKTKIRIGCPVHGIFEQIPRSHMLGFGCKACAVVAMADKRRLSADQFIARSRAAHGDKYDYSRIVYHSNDQHVEILCPEHGAFFQDPNGHMSGKGCLRCGAARRGKDRRSTTAAFIEKARAVHGDKYDYSTTDYRTSTTNVDIVCPEHGTFSQSPNNHLKGKGCPKCGVAVLSFLFRKDSKVYLAEIKAAHGDRFDYSLVNYRDAYSPVTLICVEHGPITKSAREWLKFGCFQCGREFARGEASAFHGRLHRVGAKEARRQVLIRAHPLYRHVRNVDHRVPCTRGVSPDRRGPPQGQRMPTMRH